MSRYVVFKKPIAGLDIETLGLASTSVVTQIGVFITNWIDLDVHPMKAIPPVSNFPEDWKPMVPIAFRADMNYLEQVLEGGRTEDEETVAWWNSEVPGYVDSVKNNPDAKLAYDARRGVRPVLDALFNNEGEERPEFVYINHPEFDYRILVDLFVDHALIKDFRRIVNTAQIHSMVKKLRVAGANEIRWIKHDALEDTAWNVWTTAAAAAIVEERQLPKPVLLSPAFELIEST
jgi:hypothetical protein